MTDRTKRAFMNFIFPLLLFLYPFCKYLPVYLKFAPDSCRIRGT